jgi:D-3-phosphoglycerate dehydrogenase
MSWKVLITDGIEKEGKTIIASRGVADDKKGIAHEELLTVVPEYHALIVRGRTKVTEAVMAAGKNLKVVGRMGVGVDNIDLQAARARGITVVNAPVATTIAVAELTMALMLSLVREIPRADAAMKSEKWLKKELTGTELSKKVLGVIGYGHIGEAVSKRAQAFDMKVLGFDPIRPHEEVAASGAESVTLETLIAQADIVTLHIPLIPSTKHILNAGAFGKMKDGVKIVCAARGGVIDDAALLEALESGKVSGAALDVYETEPPTDYALAKHPRVIAVPHIGAQTEEAQVRAAIDIASEVMNILEGKPARWKVA